MTTSHSAFAWSDDKLVPERTPRRSRDVVSISGASLAADESVKDSALVTRAIGGDDAAFEQLYVRHAAATYALLRRLSHSEEVAAELLQRTFVQAWKGLRSFRHEAAFTSWLYRIATNAHLAELRAATRRAVHELAVAELDQLAGVAIAPPDHALRFDLERAIASLPDSMRTAFVLHDVQGMPYEEIATITGTQPATLRAQLSRARLLLRRRMGEP